MDAVDVVWRAVRDEYVRRMFTPMARAEFGASDERLVASLGSPAVVRATVTNAAAAMRVARALGDLDEQSPVMHVVEFFEKQLAQAHERANAAARYGATA